jgi:hypothetical protein
MSDVLSVLEDLCAASQVERWPELPMINSLGRANGYDPEFQKEHLKLSGEEPTPVIPNEIEKLVIELPRDGHALQKESATNV